MEQGIKNIHGKIMHDFFFLFMAVPAAYGVPRPGTEFQPQVQPTP